MTRAELYDSLIWQTRAAIASSKGARREAYERYLVRLEEMRLTIDENDRDRYTLGNSVIPTPEKPVVEIRSALRAAAAEFRSLSTKYN